MDRRTLIRSALLLTVPASAFAEDKNTNVNDPAPAENDIDKYPRCIICNMDRRKFHYARHLLHYGDGHAEGTCSINCAAECMLKERRRGFTAIYAPDYGAEGEPKPLIEVSTASYLIGSDLRGVMSRVSKYAFSSRESALRAQAVAGGTIGSFTDATGNAFNDFSAAVVRRYESDRERLHRNKKAGPD